MRHGVQSWISWPEREAERRVENVHRRRRLLPSRSLPAHNGTQGPQGMHQHDWVRVKRIPYQQLFFVNFDSTNNFWISLQRRGRRWRDWTIEDRQCFEPHPLTQVPKEGSGKTRTGIVTLAIIFRSMLSEMQVHGPKVAHPDLASLVTRNVF